MHINCPLCCFLTTKGQSLLQVLHLPATILLAIIPIKEETTGIPMNLHPLPHETLAMAILIGPISTARIV
jgi:hypothetical protein